MPGATVAHECWRWLVWNRAPFYIDQLCISPPYTVYADPEQKQAENQRISKLNASAYVGATHGILGIPPGGRGEWTMVELRILGKRAARLPDDFGDASALLGLGLGYVSRELDALHVCGGSLHPAHKDHCRLSMVTRTGSHHQSSGADD